MRLLRAGQPLPAPQTLGPTRGVVCLRAEERPPETNQSPNLGRSRELLTIHRGRGIGEPNWPVTTYAAAVATDSVTGNINAAKGSGWYVLRVMAFEYPQQDLYVLSFPCVLVLHLPYAIHLSLDWFIEALRLGEWVSGVLPI
jgi:hypothetical protein